MCEGPQRRETGLQIRAPHLKNLVRLAQAAKPV